jgi:hypothetical protein
MDFGNRLFVSSFVFVLLNPGQGSCGAPLESFFRRGSRTEPLGSSTNQMPVSMTSRENRQSQESIDSQPDTTHRDNDCAGDQIYHQGPGMDIFTFFECNTL